MRCPNDRHHRRARSSLTALCCGTLIALAAAGCSGGASGTGTGGTLGSGGQGGVKNSGGNTTSGGGVGGGGAAATGGSAGTGTSVGTAGSAAIATSAARGGSAASGGSLGSAGGASSGSAANGGSLGTGGGIGSSGSVGTGGSVGPAGGQSTGGGVGSGGSGGSGGGTTRGTGGSTGVGGNTSGTSGTGGTGGKTTGGAGGTGGTGGTGGAGGTGGGQPFKGIAGGACKVRTAMNVSWYYNWEGSEDEPCAAPNGVEYVPMIWGADTAANIQTAVAGFASNGSKYVLGFNEPDNTTQSNITVASAIALLPAFDSVATIAVGSPATQANTTGQAWFKEYMADVAASTTLRVDFIAIHWYGWNAGSCDAAASQLESYINYAESFPGNRPIWLTEWGCLNESAPTAAGVIAFFQAALAVFARHPRLARYAWYQWSPNCEVYNTDDTLTDLGQVYAAAPATK